MNAQDREELLKVKESIESAAVRLVTYFEKRGKPPRDVADAAQDVLDLTGLLERTIRICSPDALDHELIAAADAAVEARPGPLLPGHPLYRLAQVLERREATA